MGFNVEALQLHTVYKNLYYLLEVTRESVSVLYTSHVKICISTGSHTRIHIRYCKSCALRLNVQ